jgi:hypothetical protein
MNRTLLREPLLHFLLLGAGLFLLYGWIGGPAVGEGSDIIITQGRIAQLAAGFERMRQRPPDRAEVDELIADAIREEIYYREAKALRLDEDDVLVRRRLRQKLEFLSEGTAPVPEPTDAQLQAFLEANAERFRLEPRLSFRHVYFNPQRNGVGEDGAVALLRDLRSGAVRDVDGLGDPFLLARRFEHATASELTQLFGEGFATTLQDLPPGSWHGPVKSGYGVHLVQVQRRDAERMPTLADVREGVRREWMHDWRQRENTRFYAELRDRYTVTVEGREDGTGAPLALTRVQQ